MLIVPVQPPQLDANSNCQSQQQDNPGRSYNLLARLIRSNRRRSATTQIRLAAGLACRCGAPQAREQKKDTPKTSKVFTNDNIPHRVGFRRLATAPRLRPTDRAPRYPNVHGTDEKMWRDRFATLRHKLEQDQADLDMMQREIGVLDVQNYSDP